MRKDLFKCRVCEGTGLLQHPGGQEYSMHCTECENDVMCQIGDLDYIVFELRRDNPALSEWMQNFHRQVADFLVQLSK